MTIQETSTAGGTPATAPEPHRKSRADATPLESHRQTILAWIETEKCSYQECCKRLKERFDIDCSPKVLSTHRQQWATESELETSAQLLVKSLRFTGQWSENLVARSEDFRRVLPLILQARFINAALNPATSEVTLERLSRMLHRFQSDALQREELALLRDIESNRSLALQQTRQLAPTPPHTSSQATSQPDPDEAHPSESGHASTEAPCSSSHSQPLNSPRPPSRPASPRPSETPKSTPSLVRSLTRAERKARIQAARNAAKVPTGNAETHYR